MRKVILFIIALFIAGPLFAEAEVSKVQEVGVLPVYSSYEVPGGAYQYFDDRLISILSSMKRFQVIGYHYRLDNNSAERFIAKIQDLKKQSALQNPKYMDEDLGIAVIPASDLQKMVNSFFIFVPSISGFSSKQYQVEVEEKKNGKIVIKLVTEYSATVNISIKIITAEGNLLKTYDSSIESKSRKDVNDAYQQSVSSAVSGLSFFLRNVDEFKIKTKVLKVDGGDVYIELGKDIGIYPGYEFALQVEEKVLDRFTEKKTTGIVRVKSIGTQYSIATPIFGSPQIGDQLLETPMAGGRFNIFVGMLPMAVPTDNIFILYMSPSVSFTSDQKFNKSTYAFTAGIHTEGEIGYGGLFNLNLGLMFNNPMAAYLDIGGGYEFYFGMASMTLGADLSLLGTMKSMGTLYNNDIITIKSTEFDSDINVSLMSGTIGIKPRLGLNIQLSQNFKFRVTGGYALYFLPFSSLNFSAGSGDNSKSASVSLTDKTQVTILSDGKLVDDIPINFSGPYGGVEAVFRF